MVVFNINDNISCTCYLYDILVILLLGNRYQITEVLNTFTQHESYLMPSSDHRHGNSNLSSLLFIDCSSLSFEKDNLNP